jgi:hypothetical protein
MNKNLNIIGWILFFIPIISFLIVAGTLLYNHYNLEINYARESVEHQAIGN